MLATFKLCNCVVDFLLFYFIFLNNYPETIEWHFILFLFYFWPCPCGVHCVACGILVPQPGIEPVPPALGAQSLNHGTAREVPMVEFLDAISTK